MMDETSASPTFFTASGRRSGLEERLPIDAEVVNSGSDSPELQVFGLLGLMHGNTREGHNFAPHHSEIGVERTKCASQLVKLVSQLLYASGIRLVRVSWA